MVTSMVTGAGLLIVICLVLSGTLTPSSVVVWAIPETEYNSLWDMFVSLNGSDWVWRNDTVGIPWDFLDGSDPCIDQWQGLVCGSHDHIISIRLPRYNLLGTLPDSIGSFSKLEQLHLRNNWIEGTIPDTVGQLLNLQRLQLSSNFLIGPLPDSLLLLPELAIVDVAINDLSGPLPESLICQLPALRVWNSRDNYFTGTVPDCAASLDTLQILDLALLYLVGTVPPEFGVSQTLQVFDLSDNWLTGTMPASLANMSSLEALVLSYNFLTGTIPPEYCSIPRLGALGLGYNQLHGSLDLRWHLLTNLTKLDISENRFEGRISDGLCAAPALQFLNLSYNAFTGPLPACLSNVTNLASLSAEGNQLSGPLPAELCGLSYLSLLNLGVNSFHGTIPECYGGFTFLRRLYLESAHLTGTFPSALCQLTDLIVLYFNDNQLRGSLPACLGSVSNLASLSLYSNQFTGGLPEEWAVLSNLQYLDVGQNPLGGTFPAFVTQLHRMEDLYMDYNELVGPIPEEISRMVLLRVLLLDSNYLTGTLPSAIGTLRSLESVIVKSNKLTGTLDDVFDPTWQVYLYMIQIQYNGFTGSLPEAIFELPLLVNFIAAANCFHGSLPQSMCGAKQISTISLDGMGTANACRRKILPGLSNAYQLKRHVDQPVPSCLFTLPNLLTLHLSGNSLTGTLPSISVAGSYLVDLSLSHNKLKGTIPDSFQARRWHFLDLSYNFLTGTLSDDFATLSTVFPVAYEMGWNRSYSLSLEDNRLSGRIPGYIRNAVNVSVLGSNLFSCDLSKSDLPRHDHDRDNYSCGSTVFDVPYYTWIALTGVCVILGAMAVRWAAAHPRVVALSTNMQSWLEAVNGKSLNGQPNDLVPNTALFSRICRLLCERAAVCCGYILVVLFPICLVLTTHYGTLTYQYTYTASAAFLSGPAAMAVLFMALMGLILLFVACIAQRLRAFSSVERQIRQGSRLSRNVSAASTTSTLAAVSAPANWLSWARLHNAGVYALFLAANTIVVVGVNIAYVYALTKGSSEIHMLAEIAVSAFKIVWNGPVSQGLIRRARSALIIRGSHFRAEETALILIQVLTALLNNIVIPCVVVAVISPSCFHSVLSRPPKVTAPFLHFLCVIYKRGKCDVPLVIVGSTTYSPPFQYSYQCSSSIITYYAPVYVTMCIMACFIIPTIQLAGRYWLTRAAGQRTQRSRLLWFWLPPIFLPLQEGAVVVGKDKLLNFNGLVTFIVTYLGLLLTFGAVFPPLAVALTVTLVLVTYYAKLKVGWLLCAAMAAGRLDAVETVEAECQRAGAVEVLRRSSWLLVALSCAFYTLFLFDTLGDAVGVEHAFWVLIAVPSMPAVFMAGSTMYSRLREVSTGQGVHKESNEVELGQVGLYMVGDGREPVVAEAHPDRAMVMSALHSVAGSSRSSR